MNKRFAIWLEVAILAFALAFAGCKKKEEPAPAATPEPAAPASGAPAEPGAVAPAPAGGETGPGASVAAGETKTGEKQEASPKK